MIGQICDLCETPTGKEVRREVRMGELIRNCVRLAFSLVPRVLSSHLKEREHSHDKNHNSRETLRINKRGNGHGGLW